MKKNHPKRLLTADSPEPIDIYQVNYFRIIAENIKKLRGKMTQEELAEKAGVGRSTVSAAEQGRPISIVKLLKIAEALKATPAALFMTPEEKEEFKSSVDKIIGLGSSLEMINRELSEIKERLSKGGL